MTDDLCIRLEWLRISVYRNFGFRWVFLLASPGNMLGMGRFRYVVNRKKRKFCLPISVYRTRGSREHGLGLGLGLGLEPSSLNFQKTSHLHQSSWAPRGPNDDFLFSLCATTQKMLFTEISQRHFEACIFRGICCKQKCATTLMSSFHMKKACQAKSLSVII